MRDTDHHLIRPGAVLLALLGLLTFGLPASAQAPALPPTIVVDTAEDQADPISPAWAGCATVGDADDGGFCSLREAVHSNNADGGGHTITFAAGITTISLTRGRAAPESGADDRTYGVGDLDIEADLRIDGEGRDIVIDGSAMAPVRDRIFEIAQPDTTDRSAHRRPGGPQARPEPRGGIPMMYVRIDDVTITGGMTTGDSDGGGVKAVNEGPDAMAVELYGVTITGNTSADDGGGVAFEDATPDDFFTIVDATIAMNTAGEDGGGVEYTGGYSDIGPSPTFAAAAGSDFHQRFGPSGMTIAGATIRDNSAQDEGGGISITGRTGEPSGAAAIFFSTLSGNQAHIGGGLSVDRSSIAFLFSSLVSDNTARTGSATGPPVGGGVAATGSGWDGTPATVAGVALLSSVVDGNRIADGEAGDGGGLFADDAVLALQESAVIGNRASRAGGGIFADPGDFGAGTEIFSSTISGNTALTGAAAELRGGPPDGAFTPLCGTLHCITGSTIVDNGTAASPATQSVLATATGTGEIPPEGWTQIETSILQGGVGLLCEPGLVSGGGNSFGAAPPCPTDGASDVLDVTQVLSLLTPTTWTPPAFNSPDPPQPTPHHRLQPGTEAIDALPSSSGGTPMFAQNAVQCRDTDQLGTPHDQDGDNDGTPGCDRGAHELVFEESADLTVQKTGPATAQIGDAVTYTLTVTNGGTRDALGVSLTDTVPAAMTVTGAQSPECSAVGNDVTCDIPSLPANGGQATVTIEATAAAAGEVVNQACASTTSTELLVVNNCGSVTTTVSQPPTGGPTPPEGPGGPDVEVRKVVDQAEAAVGDEVTFTIAVENLGDGTAGDVVITDQVPAGITVTGASAPCTTDGNDVTCNLGSLTPGQQQVVTVTGTVQQEGAITNTACAATSSGDADTRNNCGDATVTVGAVQTTRVEGPERITTAIAASQTAFADGLAPVVVLARQDDFADAQLGTPVASDKGGPLLLSQSSVLTPETEDEIVRVLPSGSRVYIIGGVQALSQAVEDRLVLLGYEVVRLGGPNRYGTAVQVADELNPVSYMVADGGSFSQSIVAGAAATTVDGSVLLTQPGGLPPETQAALDAAPDATLFAIGDEAIGQLPDAEPVAGADPAALSVAVAERFFPSPVAVGVATDADFADGLVAGAVVNHPDIGPGPVMLTDPDELPAALRSWLEASAADLERLLVFGGPAAIAPAVEDEINAALGL